MANSNITQQVKRSLGQRIVAGCKELVRKCIVALKRKPQTIALIMLVFTFVYYSLNLSYISNTTAKIQGPNMGLCGFAVMLFSMLSIVCFNNAFPHRKPVNIPMLILMFLMFAVILFADYTYLQTMYAAIFRDVNPIVVTWETVYIVYAQYYIQWHMIFLSISAALVVLLPIYSRMIRKIKTSIEVEENKDMGAIDISGES